MKNFRLMMAIVATVFLYIQLNAENPVSIANKKLNLLSRDIVLTDSQKVVILEKAKEFAVKFQGANLLTNSIEKNSQLDKAVQQYKAALDTLLTSEQKTQLETKRNERRDLIMNKLKSK